jgi:hypothetical protein
MGTVTKIFALPVVVFGTLFFIVCIDLPRIVWSIMAQVAETVFFRFDRFWEFVSMPLLDFVDKQERELESLKQKDEIHSEMAEIIEGVFNYASGKDSSIESTLNRLETLKANPVNPSTFTSFHKEEV